MTRGGWICVVAVPLLGAAGCELEEITVVEMEDVVVAEVYANVATDPADNEILGFLHKTLVGGDVDAAEAALVASRLTVVRDDGLEVPLRNNAAAECIEEVPATRPVACFAADSIDASRIRAGDLLTLNVELEGGGLLEGTTRVPGEFELRSVPVRCRLASDALMPIEWSRSDGAWAYVNETAILGLPDALGREGIDVTDDPLYLLGLSISDSDTTITFPSEFGVFNRFELDQDLAVRLQRGLPPATNAEVTITAVDRNFVNWARGGNFNPSGQVRVPSLRGDGAGVFGSTVVRRIVVTVDDDPIAGVPACPVVAG